MPVQAAELTRVVPYAGEPLSPPNPTPSSSAWASRIAPVPHAGSREPAAEEARGGDFEAFADSARALRTLCVREVDCLVQGALSGWGEGEGVGVGAARLEGLLQVHAWLAERANTGGNSARRWPSPRRRGASRRSRAMRVGRCGNNGASVRARSWQTKRRWRSCAARGCLQRRPRRARRGRGEMASGTRMSQRETSSTLCPNSRGSWSPTSPRLTTGSNGRD